MSDSSPQSTTYSGDVTFTGSLEPPIEMTDPDDVFVQMNGVSGDLAVNNAENVFTHSSSENEVAVTDVETTVRGDLEDGYVQDDGIAGDLRITDGEDVFIPAHAVSGALGVGGAENIYSETDVDVPSDPSVYDASPTGWRQSATVSDPDTGVYVTGARHTVEVDRTTNDIDIYVVGYGHEVTIEGRAAAVNVCILGYENTIRIGSRLSVEDRTETGFDNEVIDEPYPVEDLIETTKQAAYDDAGFGRHKTTYQMPASDEEWCPNCGAAADAIVERHHVDAWFFFGYPIKVYGKSMNPAMECEHCSMNAVQNTLTEQERKNVLG